MQCACDRHQSQCSRVKPKFRILISTLWEKGKKNMEKYWKKRQFRAGKLRVISVLLGIFPLFQQVDSFLSQESNYRKVAGFERLGGEGSGWS